MIEPPIRRRVVKPPETRRAELLDAGLAVFRKKGIKSTTVDDITVAAGVAKGTFYLYFDSKDRLFAALRERFAAELLVTAEAAVAKAPADDWVARAEALVGEAIDFAASRSEEFALVFTGHPPGEGEEAVAGAEHRFVELLVGTIQQGVKAGALHVADPETTAALIFHAVHGGLLELARHGGKKAELKRLRSGVSELVERALATSLDI